MTDAATNPMMRHYILKKFQWREEEFQLVDWNEIVQAKKGFTNGESVKITKLMYDWVNTGHQKAKMDQDKICPCCGLRKKLWNIIIGALMSP